MTAVPNVLRVSQNAAFTADPVRLSPFARMANEVARVTGKPATFVICCVTILVWAVTGPLFHYSDTWQLIINTGTTIITFLMVFLIQNTQNREGAALQAKLDELIRVTKEAHNGLVGMERLPDEKVAQLRATVAEEAAGAAPRLRVKISPITNA
jgi:low affinity Fe/Cu permease